MRPSSRTGISTTQGAWRIVAISCVRPLPSGAATCSMSTANTRVEQTIAMDLLRQLVEHALQIVRQRARELHLPLLDGMREHESGGMQERTRQVRDGAQIAGHTPVDAAVQGIADDWMADCAQMDADLMRASGMNRDVRQREDDAELLGLDDARDRFAAAPGLRRHLLPVARVASDRLVDPSSRLNFSPDERDVFLLDFPIVKLPRQLLVRGVVLRDDHQPRGAPIEPMDDAGPLLSADAAQVADVMEQRVHERAARMSGSGMDDHAGGLVDDDQVGVLIQDSQRQRLCLR